jgi:hypothetical protein
MLAAVHQTVIPHLTTRMQAAVVVVTADRADWEGMVGFHLASLEVMVVQLSKRTFRQQLLIIRQVA